MDKKAAELLEQMTLEEKAALCSGKNFWQMTGVDRLGAPEVMVTDGPHGLRKQAGGADHLGLNASVPATCFPPAATSASSWDREALYAMGQAIGEECVQEEVAVVLGPGANMKRSPLCGRNFEYFSEDPFLAGEMAASWVNGVQSQGVGTSLKHFAANNQEKARLVSNSVIDERALREIYLTAFEKTVKQAKPWTLMCSYNRINDVYSCENPWLLDQVLRKEWGFEGLVMTDWGAMDDRVEALKAGLELEMPGPSEWNDRKIVEAVKNGELEEKALDQAVERLLSLILRAGEVKKRSYDIKEHHALARRVGAEATVLLKNERALPMKEDLYYGIVGAFAEKPRYQGAGSSKINPHQVDNALEALKEASIRYEYAPGYSLEKDEVDKKLIEEAAACAKGKDGVIVFAGLPDEYESEGYDRTHLNMPESHNALIDAVCEVNDNVTVVLLCGSAVVMPWRDKVKGIVLAYLGGQAAGSACADVLTGRVNPSGRLAETFPLCLEDTPCYENFAGEGKDAEYRESILIGYRYYDWAGKDVAYPFGYGLSYTEFSYGNMRVSWNDEKKLGEVLVDVTNTGSTEGAETVQIYVGKKDSSIMRAPKELRGFEKVRLLPGQTKTVRIPLDERSFAYYDVKSHGWQIENGCYQIYGAASSRDIRLMEEISVSGVKPGDNKGYVVDKVVKNGRFCASREDFEGLFGGELPLTRDPGVFTINSTVSEIMENEKGRRLLKDAMDGYQAAFGSGNDDASRMMMAMVRDMPLRSLGMAGMDRETLEGIVEQLNA